MTSIRLSPRQKRRLEEAAHVLSARRGRRVTQGEAVDELAKFALRHRTLWASHATDEEFSLKDDPLFDPDFVIDMGRTDERTVDRTLYGRK